LEGQGGFIVVNFLFQLLNLPAIQPPRRLRSEKKLFTPFKVTVSFFVSTDFPRPERDEMFWTMPAINIANW
jgi:hypothetical protein